MPCANSGGMYKTLKRSTNMAWATPDELNIIPHCKLTQCQLDIR